jgi:hypothetical protein
MNSVNFDSLNTAVREILKRPATAATITQLKKDVPYTSDTFVWSVLEIEELKEKLPVNIRSAWIFVLKKDTPSGAHYHPNSIQHMVLIEGEGKSQIGGRWQEMTELSEAGGHPEAAWSIIPENVPHEFFPRERDMVVISFHTCLAEELQEIACDTGRTRNYEKAP